MAAVIDTFPKPVRRDKNGVLRVGNTRISLDSVVRLFNEGSDAAEIQYNYNTLSLAQIYGAISYYLHNKPKVDAYLVEQEKRNAKIREEIETMFPPDEMRKKIMARKNGEDPNWPPK